MNWKYFTLLVLKYTLLPFEIWNRGFCFHSRGKGGAYLRFVSQAFIHLTLWTRFIFWSALPSEQTLLLS